MAWIVREQEIVPIPIPLGKRVKIGSAYQPPLRNHVEYDQLWVQDVMAFGKTPWSWVRWKTTEWVVWFAVWAAGSYVVSFVARRFWQ